MPRTKTSPVVVTKPDIQEELNRLHRRRLALNNLIRSVEEYLLVADQRDALLHDVPRKQNLRVVQTKLVRELLA